MKKKFLKYFISITLIILLVSIYITLSNTRKSHLDVGTYDSNSNNAASNSTAANAPTNPLNTSPTNSTLEEIKKLCPSEKSKKLFAGRAATTRIQLAKNLHFKKEGEIYRLRTFIKDTPESSFTKLVFYKEDSSGFAQSQEIPREDSRNPSAKTLKKYLENAEVIYDEQDIRLTIDDIEINYTTINGVITKVVSNQINCYYDKP